MIFLGYLLMDHPMHYAWKMIFMAVGTFGFSWVLYEFIIRRIALLRSLFGYKSERKVTLNEEFLIRNTFDL